MVTVAGLRVSDPPGDEYTEKTDLDAPLSDGEKYSLPVLDILSAAHDYIDGKSADISYNKAIVVIIRSPNSEDDPEPVFRLLTSDNLSDTEGVGILEICKATLMNLFPDFEEDEMDAPAS